MRTTYEMSPICRRSAFSWICDSQQGNEQHSSIFEFGRRRRVRSVVNLAHRRDDRAAMTRIEPGSLSVAYFLGMCARLRNPTEAHWSAATRQKRRAVTCNAKVQCMVGRRMHNANCEGCGGRAADKPHGCPWSSSSRPCSPGTVGAGAKVELGVRQTPSWRGPVERGGFELRNDFA